MQKVSQNNNEQSIWNCKAIFITEQVTAHVREVTFVTTWSLDFFFLNLYFLGGLATTKETPCTEKNL